MARPRKDQALDLSKPIDLSAGAIERLTCPAGKTQAFLRDSKAPGLRVRVTAAGAKSYTFESKLDRQTIRRTIGDVRAWSIEAARAEANRLRVMLDAGTDPRELERQEQAAKQIALAIEAKESAARTLTVGQAWTAYLDARQLQWGDRHYQDHERLSKAGGKVAKRGTRGRGITIAGPIHPLLALRLRELDAPTIEAWATREVKTRPTAARLAWRLLKTFLDWCAEQPEYAALLPAVNPAKSREARKTLGRAKPKKDSLLREQLPAWFAGVRNLGNPTASAYLQVLLLSGARPGEVLAIRWEDLNLQWRGLTIRDKVEGERVIPMTPYVHSLLAALPRRGPWVFSSAVVVPGQTAKPISKPHKPHERACRVAGIEGLTLHGLRRSFGTLSEWLDMPAGVVAQIQGHKPSATAEKHYRVRPLDLLRVHHQRLENWILEQAGIEFDSAAAEPGLRVVSAK